MSGSGGGAASAEDRQREALLRRFPLHAALLHPGVPGAPAADPFAEGAPPLNPAHIRGPAGFTAMHAAALADAPDAIRQLAAAGCAVDARLTGAPGQHVQGGLLLELLLTDPTALSAQGAADFAVRAGASPLAVAVLALHHEAARALLAAGADARQRLQAAARRWSASLPLLMFCLTDPEAEERGAWESSADDPEHLQMLELLLEVGADPCQASQLRIADFVPPTYPLKEAMDSGEADAAGTAMARHLARLLQQHAPLQLSREAALIAAVFAAQQRDNQAVQAFVAAAAAAPPTPPHTAQRSGSMPAYSWPLLFGVAVREGLGDVAAAVLAHMSPAERQQELSGENAVWAAMGGHEGLLRQLVEAGAPFGLAEREQAVYWGIELCSPDAVRLALSWGGGPAELVPHCQAATAQAAAGSGPATADLIVGRARKWGPVAALANCGVRGFERVGDPTLNPGAPPQDELQRRAARIAEALLEAGFPRCRLDPPGHLKSYEDEGPTTSLPADSPLRHAIEREP